MLMLLMRHGIGLALCINRNSSIFRDDILGLKWQLTHRGIEISDTSSVLLSPTPRYNMRLYYQNVRGLNSKMQQVFNFMCSQQRQLDFFALTETWLDGSVSDGELFPDTYNVLRADRQHSLVGLLRGGGVLLAVRSGLKFRPLYVRESCPLFNSIPLVDIVGVSLLQPPHSVNVFVIYVPPRITGEQLSTFFEAMGALLIRYPGKSFILGDFNIPKYSDSLSSPVGDRGVRLLVNFCNFSGLRNYNFIRNGHDRILDLILSSEACIVEEAADLLVDADIHHPALYVKFATLSRRDLPGVVGVDFPPSYNFRKAHIPALYKAISEVSWERVQSQTSVDAAISILYAELYSLFDRFVPRTTPNRRNEYPPWFTSEIKQKLRSKYRNWREFKRTGDNIFLLMFKRLRCEVKEDIRRSYAAFVRRTEGQINTQPKKFWSFINSRTGRRSFPDHILCEGRIVDDVPRMVDGFASHFAGSFSSLDRGCVGGQLVHESVPDSSVLDLFSISCPSELDILAGFKTIKANFSSGPDKIPGFLISDCRHVLVKPLKHIFSLIITNSSFPEKWKMSRVVPILKKGDKFDVSNYRPVAILSNLCKVFEYVLYKRIMDYVKDKLSFNQHGFISGRSTVTNLFVITQYISDQLDKSLQVDVVYTDFTKAFDHLDHSRLLCKLHRYGFSDSLVQLLRSYLLNRSQYVECRGIKSKPFRALSGVPQGSILGPLLFNLFIDDVSCRLSARHLLYADDMKLFQCISTISDCLCLQRNLDILSEWSRDNLLTLNISKCSVLSFYRIKNPIIFDYTINGQLLRRCGNVVDLGVTFDSQLSFAPHMETLINKCYKCMGFIMRNGRDFSQETLLRLFNAFVRSRLEYASVIWSPTYVTYIQEMETILRKFLKYLAFRVDGSYPVIGYPQHLLLQRFGMSSLELRRQFHSVVFLYKVVNSQIDCPSISQLLVFNTHRTGARHVNVFYLPLARTRSQQSSPLYCLCRNFSRVQHGIDIRNTSYSEIKSAFFVRT